MIKHKEIIKRAMREIASFLAMTAETGGCNDDLNAKTQRHEEN